MRVVDTQFNEMGWNHDKPAKTIDNSTVYENWCDLTRTIADILLQERVGSSTGWLNIPEIDGNLNPGDHQSHIFSGLAALHAVNYHLGQTYPTALFVGYDTQNRPPNLGVVDAANEAGMSAAYNISLINHRIWNEWISPSYIFQEWCGRNYYRIVNSRDVGEYYDCREVIDVDSRAENGQHQTSGSTAAVYPNPAGSILIVPIPDETDDNSRVLLFDKSGKQVFEQPCRQSIPLQINVGHLRQGNYFVHIIGKNGTTIQKVAVIRE
jgi:hypothetical protein